MSKFITSIPVDVEGVLAKLPAGKFVHGIRMSDDKRSLVIEWEHDDHKTPYSIPVEYPLAALEWKEAPPKTVTVAGFKKVQTSAVATKGKGKA